MISKTKNKEKGKEKKKSLSDFSMVKPTGKVTSQGLVAYEGHDAELPKMKKTKKKKRIVAGRTNSKGKKKLVRKKTR